MNFHSSSQVCRILLPYLLTIRKFDLNSLLFLIINISLGFSEYLLEFINFKEKMAFLLWLAAVAGLKAYGMHPGKFFRIEKKMLVPSYQFSSKKIIDETLKIVLFLFFRVPTCLSVIFLNFQPAAGAFSRS